MKIVIRRMPRRAGINHRDWRIAALGAALLAAPFASANAGFDAIPGVRGPRLTIPLDPPVPIVIPRAGQAPVLTGQVPGMPDGVTYEVLAAMQSGGTLPDAASFLPAPIQAAADFDAGPPAAALPFLSPGAIDNLRAQVCLTTAIYYEAASESDDGQRAVAQVVLNRVRHPAYPNTVCGVVFQGTERGDRLCQFSFACDGAMLRMPSRGGWARARRIAAEALAGRAFAPVGLATHYHTHAVNPVWNRALVRAASIGAHVFFRFPGGASAPARFSATYRGQEPFPGPKAPAATPAAGTSRAAALAPTLPLGGAASPPAPAHGRTAAVADVRPAFAQSGDALPGGRLDAPADDQILPRYRNSGEWIGK
jgi:hypothetical protein